MKAHPNFYENLKEAQMRLRSTIVLYDGHPYCIHTITDHFSDGIFRVYMYPVEKGEDPEFRIPDYDSYCYSHPVSPGTTQISLGEYLDKFLVEEPQHGFVRKQMNSPLFNKFRPFPLGMINWGNTAYYLARQPLRKSEQGLIRSALQETPCGIGAKPTPPGVTNTRLHTKAFVSCVKAEHPSIKEVIEAMHDPAVINKAVAFHREFAITKGPIGTLFLVYRTDVVGLLANGDLSLLRLSRASRHLREVTAELGAFQEISIQS